MNKKVLPVLGLWLACGGTGFAAPAANCANLDGTISIWPLGPTAEQPAATGCEAFQDRLRRERFFEDTEFVFQPGTCFGGTINGTLTTSAGPEKAIVVSGSSLSAFTASKFGVETAAWLLQGGGPFLMAGTIVDIKALSRPGAGSKELGTLFLRDAGIVLPSTSPGMPPNAYEQLIAVGGTGSFAQANASFEIVGPEFYPYNARIRGTVCH